MESFHNPTRRALMMSLAGLSLGSATPVSVTASEGSPKAAGSPILVAYFSRTGNTRVVAGLIHRSLGTNIFEIRPAAQYPEDYLTTVEQARQERDQGIEPALEAKVPGIAGYATVFLGFPIWGETAPPIIRSFLSAHDLSGKPLIPFITHGGYGLGDSASVVARHAPRALLRPGFSMQADQERQTMDRVNSWLRKMPASQRT